MSVSITREPPRQPAVLRLLTQSDAYMASLYPAESNHLVDVSSLERPEVSFLVARHAGEIAGCCALVTSGDGTAEIKRLFVDPAARGLSIGRLLMEAIEEEGRRLGFSAIRLETGTLQPEAINLYRRFGYVEIAPFGSYQPDPLSLFMEKRLSA